MSHHRERGQIANLAWPFAAIGPEKDLKPTPHRSQREELDLLIGALIERYGFFLLGADLSPIGDAESLSRDEFIRAIFEAAEIPTESSLSSVREVRRLFKDRFGNVWVLNDGSATLFDDP